MNPRVRTNLQHVARGGWNRLGKEEQAELTGAVSSTLMSAQTP